MTLDRLQKKVADGVNEITTLVGRIRANRKNQIEGAKEVEKISSERQSYEAERAAIESASAVQLSRLKLDPATAVKRSDDFAEKARAALEREKAAQAKQAEFGNGISTDFAQLEELLFLVVRNSRLLAEAEFIALLYSWMSADTDVLYNFQKNDNLFRRTVAGEILTNRTYQIEKQITSANISEEGKQEKLLALADQIIAEPVPALARRPAEIPDNVKNSSNFVTAIAEF